jgi:hypothetical protein
VGACDVQRLVAMKPTTPSPGTPAVSFRSLAADQMPPFESTMPVHDVEPDEDRPMSVGALSKPVLGLPLMRWIPQDCHSYLDYANGLVTASTAFATDDKAAQLASITLASLVTGISAVTDYRVSVAKLVPIEVHEVADYVWGATAIAAPFALGYWKSSPKVAVVHIAAGIGSIVGALLTDYRAYSKRRRS